MAPSNNNPVFVNAGPQETPGTQSATPTAPVRSYDFLKTWTMPTSGPKLWWYKLTCGLNRDKKANHQDYLVYQKYRADVDAANAAYNADVARLQAEYEAALVAADEDYQRRFDENEREYSRIAFESETEQLIKLLRFLDNLEIRPIMAFCNIKSAGKTTALLEVLSVIAQYTRRMVFAIPATQNSATSTLALMAGVSETSGITIEELSRRIDELGTYRALSSKVPKTPNGVSIVSEDLNNALDVNNEYNLDKFVELLLKVLPNVDYLGLDLGNDNIRNDSIALAAARFAHVLNFSYLYRKSVSVRSFENTVAGYNTDLHSDVNQYNVAGFENVLAQTGVGVPTPAKVAGSIVIANLAPLDAEIDFGKHMDPQQRVDSDLSQWQGKGFNIPYDPYLDNADESGEVKPANLDYITPVTHQQALKIAVANLLAAAKVQGVKIKKEDIEAQGFKMKDDDIASIAVVAPKKPVVQKHVVPEPVLPPVPEIEHPFPSLLS